MGFGFVAIAWLFILSVAATGAAIYLGVFVHLLLRSSPQEVRFKSTAAAAAFPYLLLFYFGLAFIGYTAWCFTRGVDPGIGDIWEVPLDGGYRLYMIDIPEQAFLAKKDVHKLNMVSHLDEEAGYLYGKSSEGYFLLNTRSDELRHFDLEEELRSAMKAHGLSPPVILKSAISYYHQKRWGLPDVVAVSVIFGIPAFLTLVLVWKKSPREFRRRRVLVIVASPFVIALYFLGAFSLYSLWCVYGRGVDALVFGDKRIPIQHEYSLEIIDSTEDAVILKDGQRVVSDVSSLEQNGSYLYGKAGDEYFLLDMNSGKVVRADSKNALTSTLTQYGISYPKELSTVYSFYYERRWRRADLFAFGTIFVIPPLVLLRLAEWKQSQYFYKVWGRQRMHNIQTNGA